MANPNLLTSSDKYTIEQIFDNQTVSISPAIGTGHVNRVYLVIHNETKFIVRINDEGEIKRFQKEAWCIEAAQNNGINCPKIFSTGVKNYSAFMVCSFVEGKNAGDITDDKESVWLSIGSIAKNINSISTTGYGENMSGPGIFTGSWEGYLKYNIESLNQNDKLLSLDVIDKPQQNLLKDIFLKLSHTKFNFGLIHGDLSFDNIILGQEITLIDWGCASSTIVPHMEIIELIKNQIPEGSPIFNSFLKGYGMSLSQFESIKPEIDALSILQSVDKFRWAIDRKPDKIGEFSQRIKSYFSLRTKQS